MAWYRDLRSRITPGTLRVSPKSQAHFPLYCIDSLHFIAIGLAPNFNPGSHSKASVRVKLAP